MTSSGSFLDGDKEQMLIERHCPHCGSSLFKASALHSKDEWRVGDCGSCGFTFLQNAPVYDRLVEEFAWEKSLTAESDRRHKERPVTARLSMLFRHLRKPFRASEKKLFLRLFKTGNVLDVGCGDVQRIPRAFTPYGIEISSILSAISDRNMKKRGGHVVHAPAVEGIAEFKTGFFNGVILRSFLEHEWQPKKLLDGARRVLCDEGAIFVRVPNYASYNRKVRGAQWCGFRHPDHVNYFTPDSLNRMAADCGLHMKLLNPFKISIDDNIKAVLTKA